MQIILRIMKGNLLPRFCVGLLIAFFLYCGVNGRTDTDSSPASHLINTVLATEVSSDEDYTNQLIEYAKTDHIALLKFGMKWLKNIFFKGDEFKIKEDTGEFLKKSD